MKRGGRPGWRILTPVAAVFLILVLADLFLVHRLVGAPDRATLLAGFYANPGTVVDDALISDLGFTGDAITKGKHPGTLRVLTLGGSVLFNRRFTGKLKAALEKRLGRPVEVVGAAFRGHKTWASVRKLALLSGYHFDYVVICHGVNDLLANNVAPEDFREDYSHVNPWYRRGFLLDRSTIARLFYNVFLHRRPPRRDPPGCLSGKVFSRNMERLVDETRGFGATPLLLTFAWTIPEGYSLARFRKNEAGFVNPGNYDPCPVELWGPPGYVAECLEENNRAVRELAARKRVPLLDAEALLGKDPVLFGDFCHPNDRGVGILTDAIAEKTAELYSEKRS
ncbi:MAG: SGNH/GDSL hydrolase family protein [Thermodesulfobacteriota bacterium]